MKRMDLKVRSVVIGLTILGLGILLIAPTEAVVDKEGYKVKEQSERRQELVLPDKPGIPETDLQEPQTPKYAPGEVLVGLKEGVDIEDVLKDATIKPESFGRIYDTKPAINKFKKELKLEKDSEGWYPFLGKNYQEVADIPDEELFQEAYKAMPEVERRLYRSYKIKLPEDITVEEVVAKLTSNPNVRYAQPNYLNEIYMVPNDPYYHSHGSWGQDYDDLWGLKKIQCEAAWNISQGEGVVVAVIDTGVDYNHLDLKNNMWTDTNGKYGYDFSDDDDDPTDYYGHGTHVAGTIAAVGKNGIGIIGVAPRAKIMAVKIFPNAYDDVCAQAIRYAADNEARVLNNSWGPGGRRPSNPTVEEAIDYAYEQGCIVIFAAGNKSADVIYYSPANYSKTIAVSASDPNDEKVDFSNYGSLIDVAAPGGANGDMLSTPTGQHYYVNILSLRAEGTDMYLGAPNYTPGEFVLGGNHYRCLGTSMAAPHVAGVVALIWSHHSGFSNEEITQVLRVSADDVGEAGWDENSGYGRVNANKALQIDSVCIAHIISPLPGKTVGGVIDIIGTASGDNFQNYKLEYGTSASPESWVQIGTDFFSPVTDGVLGSWDTSLVSDQKYTLRLTVTGAGGNLFVDRTVVITQNTSINSPKEDQFLRAGEAISIEGVARGTFFENYSIEWGEGENPNLWSSSGITLTDGGLSEVVDGILATWDTGVITSAGYFSIRLTVNYIGFTNTDTVTIHLDPTLQEGWPRKIDPAYGWGGMHLAMTDMPIVADVDNNGTKEILIAYGHKVYVFRHNGEYLDGWPKEFPDNLIQTAPAVADLDNDGFKEISVTTGAAVYVWNHDGSLFSSDWPISSNEVAEVVAIDDVDNDGELEIITVGANNVDGYGFVNILNNSGELENQIRTFYGLSDFPAIGDMDNDGDKEIVFKHLSTLYAYHHDGERLDGWPLSVLIKGHSYPVLGDIDGDGYLDVVIATENKVCAFKRNGDNVDGWPQETLAEVKSTAALGDIDGDGYLEVVAGTDEVDRVTQARFLYVWEHNGDLADGWPTSVSHTNSLGFGSASLGDIDGDGENEIVVGDDTFLRAHNYDRFNFPRVDGFPKRSNNINAWPNNRPALADLDNDGDIEVIYVDCSGYIFVWDLHVSYDATKMEWPMFHHDPQLTGCYESPQVGDSDNDGMPDDYELAHGCLNPMVDDANLDFDGDSITVGDISISLTNIEEMILGTDPCNADSDEDEFNDGVELYLGTDPLRACGPDAWPLDMNNDRCITVGGDTLKYRGKIGAKVGDANYDRRLDLNADGVITVVGDVLLYRGKIGQTCE